MAFKHALLGLLANGPLHGYELRAAWERDLNTVARLNPGQVYTTLERLEGEGLVGHQAVGQRSRPDKKVFSLTEAGRRALQEWLGAASAPDLDLRNETFMKLMVSRVLEDGDPLHVLEAERGACMDRLSEVASARDSELQRGGDLTTRLLLDLAVLRLEAFLRWLDDCREALEEELAS